MVEKRVVRERIEERRAEREGGGEKRECEERRMKMLGERAEALKNHLL